MTSFSNYQEGHVGRAVDSLMDSLQKQEWNSLLQGPLIHASKSEEGRLRSLPTWRRWMKCRAGHPGGIFLTRKYPAQNPAGLIQGVGVHIQCIPSKLGNIIIKAWCNKYIYMSGLLLWCPSNFELASLDVSKILFLSKISFRSAVAGVKAGIAVVNYDCMWRRPIVLFTGVFSSSEAWNSYRKNRYYCT